jgi:hypothetical protein
MNPNIAQGGMFDHTRKEAETQVHVLADQLFNRLEG